MGMDLPLILKNGESSNTNAHKHAFTNLLLSGF